MKRGSGRTAHPTGAWPNAIPNGTLDETRYKRKCPYISKQASCEALPPSLELQFHLKGAFQTAFQNIPSSPFVCAANQ